MRTAFTAAAALLFPVIASAAPITVHNTGVDALDALVGYGQTAAFWQLLAAPSGATEVLGSSPAAFDHPAYAPNTTTSQWVAHNNGNVSVTGIYTYALTIDLTGLDHTTAVISGLFATDNEGFISVNGGPAAATTGYEDFAALTAFTLNSGFIAGLNTIQLSVNNAGNPTAFHVNFTSATANPFRQVFPSLPH
jgi:hypothetical protein